MLVACGCDFTGSIGRSCNEEGTCTCKNSFDGKTCNVCKEGFYNYPLCEGWCCYLRALNSQRTKIYRADGFLLWILECNCNPAGVLATFGGCGSLSDGLLCECKERVMGRICNTCKPLYWNLRGNNPLGCDGRWLFLFEVMCFGESFLHPRYCSFSVIDCDCHEPGTIGGLRVCSSSDGQCMCKPNVMSRRCETCRDGTYQLQESNLFGCIGKTSNFNGDIVASLENFLLGILRNTLMLRETWSLCWWTWEEQEFSNFLVHADMTWSCYVRSAYLCRAIWGQVRLCHHFWYGHVRTGQVMSA